ncbi:MAG: hypothetical protein JSS96_00495 [Bacteroidetes bacterium]|nr:hypothetical protein [Bacteroidota bacterium]
MKTRTIIHATFRGRDGAQMGHDVTFDLSVIWLAGKPFRQISRLRMPHRLFYRQ